MRSLSCTKMCLFAGGGVADIIGMEGGGGAAAAAVVARLHQNAMDESYPASSSPVLILSGLCDIRTSTSIGIVQCTVQYST